MSYVSELLGAVRMSRKAYERFTRSAGELLRSFDCIDYIEGRGEVVLHRLSPWDGADEHVVALLARFKDRDGLDTVEHFGEDPLDRGRYYIGRSRWCYVRAVVPPPPPDGSPEWRQEVEWVAKE